MPLPRDAEGEGDGESELPRMALAIASSPVSTPALGVDLREYPLRVIAASQACRKVLYTTKGEWLLLRLMEGVAALPGDVALLWRRSTLVSTAPGSTAVEKTWPPPKACPSSVHASPWTPSNASA